MADAAGDRTLPKIGVVAGDEVRIAGIEAILGGEYVLTRLRVPRAAELAELEMVIIDASVTEHLFAMVAAFQRMRPQIRLLILGEERDEAFTEAVIGAGVQGYLSYQSGEAELRGAVEAVRDGSVWAPRRVLARLLDKARRELRGMARVPEAISRRERDVLRLLLQGKSNREIGGALRIEEGTVKSHLSRLMKKAGVVNRTELTMRALEGEWGKF